MDPIYQFTLEFLIQLIQYSSDVSKDRRAFIFRVKQAKKSDCSWAA
jgi:hypothetical protein